MSYTSCTRSIKPLFAHLFCWFSTMWFTAATAATPAAAAATQRAAAPIASMVALPGLLVCFYVCSVLQLTMTEDVIASNVAVVTVTAVTVTSNALYNSSAS